MSKMSELSVNHEAYEQYEESMRQELREEGAEELRIELLRRFEELFAPVTLDNGYPPVAISMAESVRTVVKGAQI